MWVGVVDRPTRFVVMPVLRLPVVDVPRLVLMLAETVGRRRWIEIDAGRRDLGDVGRIDVLAGLAPVLRATTSRLRSGAAASVGGVLFHDTSVLSEGRNGVRRRSIRCPGLPG